MRSPQENSSRSSRVAATIAAEWSAAESKVEPARSVFKREQNLYDQKVTPRQHVETAQSPRVIRHTARQDAKRCLHHFTRGCSLGLVE